MQTQYDIDTITSMEEFQFKVVSPFEPAGDQVHAIAELSKGFLQGATRQTLLGVTGSGKTYTMAKVIEKIQKPTLVLSHNKTLAAQLYREFKDFFPHNAVEYFVSYYDYYQPEAYVASRDLYIEKDASINAEIERMRLAATTALMERGDVIIIATVSAIYGLGNPESYKKKLLRIKRGAEYDLSQLSRDLINRQYERNDMILDSGYFRVKGDVIEVFPPYREHAYRILFDWDEVVKIQKFNPISLEVLSDLDQITIFPATHFIVDESQLKNAIKSIQEELEERCEFFIQQDELVKAQRLRSRTEYDLEMLGERGTCKGVENYSRPLNNSKEGERPGVLLDYFQEDFLTIVDESHVTLGQINGMFNGDRARKQNLVDHGFRLVSALDNRPLYYAEFEKLAEQMLYVSATPREAEMEKSSQVVEQLIRPTGLLDPAISVYPTEGQIEVLFGEIHKTLKAGFRVLITTLTKKMAESFTDFLLKNNIATRYLHSEIETIERVEIINQLRAGEIDVIVGINLLREGLDMPEVALVAIMDADKIGFLRSKTSLIQIIGRAARNSEGRVIMFADTHSSAMIEAIDENNRRRTIQQEFNAKHNITPQTVVKDVKTMLTRTEESDKTHENMDVEQIESQYNLLDLGQRQQLIAVLEKEMKQKAHDFEFEQAAILHKKIKSLRKEK